MAVKNYYKVLGVKPFDKDETIKKAYRNLAKQYHPDLHPGDKSAELKMREIGEAWEVLGDPEKRKKYDHELRGDPSPIRPGPSKAPTSGRPMTQEDFFRMSKGFDDILSEDAIKNSVAQSKAQRKSPMGSADFFEHVIGFKGYKKK